MDRGACDDCYGGDWEGCIDGEVYGPCGDYYCDGLCEYYGHCDCECHSGPAPE